MKQAPGSNASSGMMANKKTLFPVALIHILSFMAWVIFLGSMAGLEHRLRQLSSAIDILNSSSGSGSVYRHSVTDFGWLLVCAYPFVMLLHIATMLVRKLAPLKTFVAILLGVLLAWFGKLLDDYVQARRTVVSGGDLDHSLRAAQAGGVLCCFAIVAALLLVSVDLDKFTGSLLNKGNTHATGGFHGTGPAPVPVPVPMDAAQIPVPAAAAQPGMLQASCPACRATTNYPPEYSAVCCSACGTVIQTGAPTDATAVPLQ